MKRALGAMGKSATRDTVKVYTVDSSWGDGGDPSAGGVMRRTWVRFDDGKTGIWLAPLGARPLVETPLGPYDHPLLGVYRPDEAR